MKVKSALVLANPKKQVALRVSSEVRAFLESRGVAISGSSPQLVITVGGDGTVLYNKRHYGVPFFCIGSTTSFICQAKFSNWKPKLLKALNWVRVERRLLLETHINGRKMPLALNEVGIRNPEPRVLSIHLAVGRKHYAFRADGLLFSTPTGSPAYCFSCNGKEMPRRARKYQIVAISPFRRLFPPTIVGQNTPCTLRFSGTEKATLFIDGQTFGTVSERDALRVSASRKAFYFVK